MSCGSCSCGRVGLSRARGTPDAGAGGPAALVLENKPHDFVMALWRRAFCCVVPSLWAEPLSRVALEAMTCGVPVIASAVWGLPEAVVPGDTGLLVPPGDPTALAVALRRLILDPAAARRMGEAGHRRYQRMFSPEAVIPKIEEVYRAVTTSTARE